MKKVLIGIAIGLAVIVLTVLGIVGNAAGWFVSRSVDVVKQQADPQTLLTRYEWFKDASASLDSLKATIGTFQSNADSMEASYKGVPRNQWASTDSRQYNQWLSEISGTKADYNELAAQYNADMAKINYKFCNVGTLPQGASEVLPRSYRTYIDQ